jgi:hypothetical protein
MDAPAFHVDMHLESFGAYVYWLLESRAAVELRRGRPGSQPIIIWPTRETAICSSTIRRLRFVLSSRYRGGGLPAAYDKRLGELEELIAIAHGNGSKEDRPRLFDAAARFYHSGARQVSAVELIYESGIDLGSPHVWLDIDLTPEIAPHAHWYSQCWDNSGDVQLCAIHLPDTLGIV